MLIVDDSTFMRDLIKKCTRGLGVEVVGEAQDGVIGVEKYKELMPDIVTLDLAMPGGNGIDALAEIMQHNPKANVIIITSAAGQEHIVQEALELGATGVIDKTSIKPGIASYINKINYNKFLAYENDVN